MLSSKEIAEIIYADDNINRLISDYERYQIYNGQLKDIIKSAIKKEFILQETVNEMINRIIPINIAQKVTNKLAGVYRIPPKRAPVDENDGDQEAIDALSQPMEIDLNGKQANRYFKLCKIVAWEPYVNKLGFPKIRTLPAHTFTPISDDPIEPEQPTYFVKHIDMADQDKKNHVHIVWSDTEHYTMDGHGMIIVDEENPEAINPYGKIPFVLIKDTLDRLIPLQDDDLISMQIAICLLLTDLAFATKYQAWSIIYLIGASTEKMSFNPNSIISLPIPSSGIKPEIGTIKPDLDSDAMLRQVETLVGMLLTTKSLSVNAVLPGLQASNASSGVAKLLDQAESTEDKNDQKMFFIKAEKQLWDLIAKNCLPVWIKAGLVDPKYAYTFSPEFELSIVFPDMKPIMTEKEVIELQKMKVEAGFTTQEQALKATNPDLNDDQISELQAKINKESADKSVALVDAMADIAEDNSGGEIKAES